MRRFLELSRAPFFTAIVSPALLGTALAWRVTGRVDWFHFALTLLGLVGAHAGANLVNDYYDYRLGADVANPNRGAFSGGSPHIVEGREKARTFLAFGLASFAFALACGAALAWRVDHGPGPVLGLAVAGFLLAFTYTAPPVSLAYRGLGEPAVLLGFGPLPVVGAYYVQTGALSATAVLAGLPLSLLITNIIWINEFPDCESDRAAGKLHLVARLGLPASRWVYHALAAAAFVLVAVFSAGSVYGPAGLVALAAAPVAFAAARRLHRRFREPKALVPAQGLTIAAHLLTGLLLTAALALGA